MSLLVLTNWNLYKRLMERGSGAIGRVYEIIGKSEKTTGRTLFQFKIAVKKYAETISDECKQEYYIVKAWGELAEECEMKLRKGCIITFAGEFVERTIKLLQLLDIRQPKNKEEN